MSSTVIRFVTLATFSMALIAVPSFTPVLAAGGGGGDGAESTSPPSSGPPASDTKATRAHKSKKSSKQSSFDDPTFARSYRAAYDTIYQRNDYAAAIDQLKALGHDDQPNV